MNSRSDKPPGTADLAVMTTITALQLKTVMGNRVITPPSRKMATMVTKGYLVEEMKTILRMRMKPKASVKMRLKPSAIQMEHILVEMRIEVTVPMPTKVLVEAIPMEV